jgi:hypothetical protein
MAMGTAIFYYTSKYISLPANHTSPRIISLPGAEASEVEVQVSLETCKQVGSIFPAITDAFP